MEVTTNTAVCKPELNLGFVGPLISDQKLGADSHSDCDCVDCIDCVCDTGGCDCDT